MNKSYKYTLTILLLILGAIIIAIYQLPDNNLHIIACDVGQGDAILVTFKNIQILTDGGPDSTVLNCLGRHVPFWDKNIELLISSHPDADHLTGLVDVIKKNNVGKILMNPVNPGTDIYQLLGSVVGGKGVGVIRPVEGMSLGVDLIHLDIVSNYDPTIHETNVNSIVYELKYKQFSALFPGDIPKEVSDLLAPKVGRVNYIKIPHHGSTNGLTQNLLEKLVPQSGLPRSNSQHEPYTNSIEKVSAKAIGVISVGKKNMWGFPSPEILKMLMDNNVKVLRTDLMGDVEVITNGKEIWWKN